MDEDHGSQQPPSSSLSIHMQHSKDLQKANASVPKYEQEIINTRQKQINKWINKYIL